mmetsp:Transcript_56498/g.183036  ORF Transcript_56498/g.183036 Transcript_56498/m.183036 type:complete len:412 (-) Transcript_56498:98-1333(-)
MASQPARGGHELRPSWHTQASACTLDCGIDDSVCPRGYRDPRERYLVVRYRSEQLSPCRWYLAYAMIVAKLTNRTLVAPGVKAGKLIDPTPNQLDLMDVFELQHKYKGVPVLPMRRFLALVPLVMRNLTWSCNKSVGGRCTVQEVVPTGTEALLADRVAKLYPQPDVLVLHPTGELCTNFLSGSHKTRNDLANSLGDARPCIKQYVVNISAEFGGNVLAVHWRSMTHALMTTLFHNFGWATKNPPIPEAKQTSHHQTCAKQLVATVGNIRRTVRPTRVVLFSDVHTGCNKDGLCGYTEFDGMWRKSPSLRADRDKAVAMLAEQDWVNGDELVGLRLVQHPIFGIHSSRWSTTILGIIIQKLISSARHLSVCQTHCGACARANSLFVKQVLRMRSSVPKGNHSTWLSWRHEP